ncbi:hypothetical protein BDZ45DRAFT_810816 [Acephala macrosclerotiorum]|nr:hypothetical protein BDZ45DRAFT_810816 [Acephala macrosclerotiorum]
MSFKSKGLGLSKAGLLNDNTEAKPRQKFYREEDKIRLLDCHAPYDYFLSTQQSPPTQLPSTQSTDTAPTDTASIDTAPIDTDIASQPSEHRQGLPLRVVLNSPNTPLFYVIDPKQDSGKDEEPPRPQSPKVQRLSKQPGRWSMMEDFWKALE